MPWAKPAVSLACKGRGCNERALHAARAFYEARRAGLTVRPRDFYGKPPFFTPKQSFHNALARLLEVLGHSKLFKEVLYGRLGCLVCRCAGAVAWEHYGARRLAPPCRPPCTLEEWPGPQSPVSITWRGGTLNVRMTTDWNLHAVAFKLREVFGCEWFTARQAAEVLLISPRSASQLLSALETAGLAESEPIQGKTMKRYRVKVKI